MNPLAVKAIAILATVFALLGAGFKAGSNSEKAAQLKVLQQATSEYQAKLKEQQAKLKEQQAKAETLIKSVEQKKQRVKIKWKVKYETIYRDRKRDDVLCYDAIRMQRQKERVSAANTATKAFQPNATTNAAITTD